MSLRDPYIYRIKQILKVVDGDTIDASIDLGFDISLEKRIRLAAVDTPESRTADANEKKYGLQSKEWLKHKVENAKNILIKTELLIAVQVFCNSNHKHNLICHLHHQCPSHKRFAQHN